ncbi:very-long-chain aldehyde decarbonylase CER1-like isoform X2 [Humulus lupulus]|uniref:very-long-chain aldehyde decarbonylase CER1-like isoform X2 n=1 Tax=Humulus lupulus TaxID=3486 RepID=UPI002B417E45|nr:very-long-chain aldehyde decarbonylase CER1-like isoform X2 [Humulus lupulus]
MASTPGILSEWPWKPLGKFKYLILAPWVIRSTYMYVTKEDPRERDLSTFLIFPFLLSRMLHNQIWISLSRYRLAKGNNRIVDKSLEFDQVDRERNWDDQILFNGILHYLVTHILPNGTNVPTWRTEGVIMAILLHAGVVEFLYYWLHRALHHHYLYSRYHSHHHSSIVTEPITSVTHPFAEHMSYFFLFGIPLLTTTVSGTGSQAVIFGYVTYIDFMNNLGHCNFELIPKWFFYVFPPLKYLMFHSLHHTQFRTNYSLFMPIYDYIYGTVDKSLEDLYEMSLKRKEELPNVVYLTHLTTPESIYYMQIGFPGLASRPHDYSSSKWYLWFMWPLTALSSLLAGIYGRTFVVESHRFHKLTLQTWVVPKYKKQYFLQGQKSSITNLIEKAVLDAEEKGVKVLSLGLLNQTEESNAYGEVYVKRHPKLKVKVVDGSSLAAAVILNSIPKGTTQILLTGNLTKVAYAVAFALCQKGIQVASPKDDEYKKLKESFINVSSSAETSNLVLTKKYFQKVWLVGDGMNKEEQVKAPKGTIFIPFSQFPPQPFRKDCFYYCTPAMYTPASLENLHSCENWLPRRVMSAWRIAGIVHGFEGWNEHECGFYTTADIHKVWQATLRHGFQPLPITFSCLEV